MLWHSMLCHSWAWAQGATISTLTLAKFFSTEISREIRLLRRNILILFTSCWIDIFEELAYSVSRQDVLCVIPMASKGNQIILATGVLQYCDSGNHSSLIPLVGVRWRSFIIGRYSCSRIAVTSSEPWMLILCSRSFFFFSFLHCLSLEGVPAIECFQQSLSHVHLNSIFLSIKNAERGVKGGSHLWHVVIGCWRDF